jgi:hypothetical protein
MYLYRYIPAQKDEKTLGIESDLAKHKGHETFCYRYESLKTPL